MHSVRIHPSAFRQVAKGVEVDVVWSAQSAATSTLLWTATLTMLCMGARWPAGRATVSE